MCHASRDLKRSRPSRHLPLSGPPWGRSYWRLLLPGLLLFLMLVLPEVFGGLTSQPVAPTVPCALPEGGFLNWGGYEFLSLPWPPSVLAPDIDRVVESLGTYGFTGMRAFVNAYFQAEGGGLGVFPYPLRYVGGTCGGRTVQTARYCLSEWDDEYFRRVRRLVAGFRRQNRPGKVVFSVGHKYQCSRSYVYGVYNPGPWCWNVEGRQVGGDWLERWAELSAADRQWVIGEYVRLARRLRAAGVRVFEVYNEAHVSARYHAHLRAGVLAALEALIEALRQAVPDAQIQLNTEPVWEGDRAVLDDPGYADAWRRLSPRVDYWSVHGLTPATWPADSPLFHEMARSGKLEIADEGQFCSQYHPEAPVMCRCYCGGELFQTVVRWATAHGYRVHFEHDAVGGEDLDLIPAWNRRELEEMRQFCQGSGPPTAHIEVNDEAGGVVVPRDSLLYVTWGSVRADDCWVTRDGTLVGRGICGLTFERTPGESGPGVWTYRVDCSPGGSAAVRVWVTEAVCGDGRCERSRGERHGNCRRDCPPEPQARLLVGGRTGVVRVPGGRPYSVAWKTRGPIRECRLMRWTGPDRWTTWMRCPAEAPCEAGVRSDTLAAGSKAYYTLQCLSPDAQAYAYLVVVGEGTAAVNRSADRRVDR